MDSDLTIRTDHIYTPDTAEHHGCGVKNTLLMNTLHCRADMNNVYILLYQTDNVIDICFGSV